MPVIPSAKPDKRRTSARGSFARTLLPALLLFTLLIPSGSAADRQILSGHLPAALARFHLPPLARLTATNRLKRVPSARVRNLVFGSR